MRYFLHLQTKVFFAEIEKRALVELNTCLILTNKLLTIAITN